MRRFPLRNQVASPSLNEGTHAHNKKWVVRDRADDPFLIGLSSS